MKKILTACISVVICIAAFVFSNVPQVTATNVTPSFAGVVATAGGNLNVRASASSGSSVLTTLKNGSYVSVIEESGSYYKVLYANGKAGYCHKSYIDLVSGSSGAYVNTSSTSLNIRSGPSTSYGVIGAISKGASVVVISTHGNFYRILYSGTQTGYASSSYIKLRSSSTSNSGSQSSTSTGAISLSVPSYKQYDSRWSNVKLGSSSKTIGVSGCLTTAIAMERSYAYGYTVTPATVATSSSYTSGGSIYWPSAYSFIYSSNYLTQILNLLKQGKPVIVGASNEYGSQHWVIVTGYTPNGSVTADDFSVNDSGSASRTTLSSFFNVYSTFYKAAYRT